MNVLIAEIGNAGILPLLSRVEQKDYNEKSVRHSLTTLALCRDVVVCGQARKQDRRNGRGDVASDDADELWQATTG